MSQLNGHGFRVAMIGDGLNDFPALAMADEGTGLSLHGPQSTGAVVDMSILSGQLNRLIILFDITDRTVRHVRLIVGLIGLVCTTPGAIALAASSGEAWGRNITDPTASTLTAVPSVIVLLSRF